MITQTETINNLYAINYQHVYGRLTLLRTEELVVCKQHT